MSEITQGPRHGTDPSREGRQHQARRPGRCRHRGEPWRLWRHRPSAVRGGADPSECRQGSGEGYLTDRADDRAHHHAADGEGDEDLDQGEALVVAHAPTTTRRAKVRQAVLFGKKRTQKLLSVAFAFQNAGATALVEVFCFFSSEKKAFPKRHDLRSWRVTKLSRRWSGQSASRPPARDAAAPSRTHEMAGVAVRDALEIILVLGFRLQKSLTGTTSVTHLAGPQAGRVHIGNRVSSATCRCASLV